MQGQKKARTKYIPATYSYTYTQIGTEAWVDFGKCAENVQSNDDLRRHLAYYGFHRSKNRGKWYCPNWTDIKKFRRIMAEFFAYNPAKASIAVIQATPKTVKTSATSLQQPTNNRPAFAEKRPIVYYVPEPIRSDNPFDLLTQPESNGLVQVAYNHLLSWLSATGEGSWNVFRQVCAELGLTAAGEIRHLFRRLRLLGHVEYLDDGQRWVVAPPCLVQMATAGDEYVCFLAGARTPRLLDQFAHTIKSVQTVVGAPDRVQLDFDTRDAAEQGAFQIASQLGPIHVVGPTALRLVDTLPEIEGWRRQILRPLSIPIDRYKIMRWDGQDFSQWVATPTESGMYQLSDSMTADTASVYYLFYDTEDGSWRQGDWYGLRYLANVSLGHTAQLLYQIQRKQLYVPDSDRLPDLYERALVLASGMLPTPADGGVVFHDILPHLATVLASKVQAHLEKVV